MAKEKNNKSYNQSLEDKIWAKVEKNIEGIYRNKKIKIEIIKFRKMLKIPNGLFKNNKAKLKEATDIDELLNQLVDIWADSIPEEGSTLEKINKNIAMLHIEYEVGKKEADKIGLNFPTQKNYAVDVLRNFIQGKSIIYYLMKKNSNVWKKVISAMLLFVPMNEVLKYKKSILKDYLPTIDDNLMIQIHELTSITDIEYIRPEIKKKKKEFEKKYGWKNIKRKYRYYERDKRAYELYVKQGLSLKKTRLKLCEEMPEQMPKECEDSYINKMIKSFMLHIGEI